MYRSFSAVEAFHLSWSIRAVAASGVPRREVFLVTKLPPRDMGEASARAAIEKAQTFDVLPCLYFSWTG